MGKIKVLAKIPWLSQTNWISQKDLLLQVIFSFEDYLLKTRAFFAVLLIYVILSCTSFPNWLRTVALECQTCSGFQTYYSASTFGMNLSDRSNDAFKDCTVINLRYIYRFCKTLMSFIKFAKQFRIPKRNLVQKENVTYTKCVRMPWM